jgi:hypothetical protein
MTQAPVPAMPVQPRRPGPGLGMSLVVMGVGLVISIISVVVIVVPVFSSFTSPVCTVPGPCEVHLRDARYIVYQRTGTRAIFGSSQSGPVERISPALVTVRAPDGSLVPVTYTSKNETITRGSAEYTSSLEFDAPTRGLYQLSVLRDPANPTTTTVIVARSITDALHGVLAWFGVGALGGLIMVVGLVMLIVGATRRGRAKRAQYGYGPPQQWGPSPQQWGPPQQQQWGPPPQRWTPPPQQQQQWTPPPQQQQQWPPPPAEPPPPQQQWPPPPTDPPAV